MSLFIARSIHKLPSIARRRSHLPAVHEQLSHSIIYHQVRYLSEQPPKETKEDLKEVLENIRKKQQEKAKAEGKVDETVANNSSTSFLSTVTQFMQSSYSTAREQLRLAYSEMMGEEKQSALKRKLKQAETYKPPKHEADMEEEEGDAKERVSAIVAVDEGKSAWESMKERLQDSPLIKEILKNSRAFGKVASDTSIGKQAKNISQNVQDKVADLREVWETSQNPIVYTVSGIWENMTGETEEGLATAAFRRLDPKFTKEEWAEDVRTNLTPMIIKAQLTGDLKTLKAWLGEAVYNKLAADIKIRKADGITIDSNILNIDENGIFLRVLDDDRPVIAVAYLVQLINCVRKRGEIIEGSETDIRAKYYTIAFHQIYDEETEEVRWQIIDYDFSNDFPYF